MGWHSIKERGEKSRVLIKISVLSFTMTASRVNTQGEVHSATECIALAHHNEEMCFTENSAEAKVTVNFLSLTRNLNLIMYWKRREM